MTTNARIGHTTEFQRDAGGASFAAIAEVTNISAPTMTKDVVDATHMTSPEGWREYIAGLKDGGEVTIDYNLVPGGTDIDTILADLASTSARDYKIVFPDATEWTFSAFCINADPAIPLDDKMAGSATFKLTGKPGFFA